MLGGKAQTLRTVLLDRIQSGQYPIGSKLPGIRQLAQEFQLHANTVNKVYSELTLEGVLKTVQGSGTFVMTAPERGSDAGAEAELIQGLGHLAKAASRMGLSREQFAMLADAAMDEAFVQSSRRVWFIECNVHDTEDLALSLSTVLGMQVEPLTTQQLARPLERGRISVEDLVVTTPFHRDEVEEHLGTAGDINEVGIVPTAETLVSIARLPFDAEYSVVASNAPTLDRFVRLLRNYTRREPQRAFLVSDEHAWVLARETEYLFDSQSIHDQVLEWRPDKPILTLRYQIEPTSVAYVRELLQPGNRP